METPDPCLRCYYGQQLVVHWKLPQGSEGPHELLVDLRFGTRELDQVCIPLTQSSGFWVYKLINSDYWCRGGILSYRVRLLSDEGCLDEWKHHLWADVVLIENEY